MSRIGKMPIPVKSGVKVAIDGDTVSIEGSKGSLSYTLPRGIRAEMQEQDLVVLRADDSKQQRAFHGLSRALLANAVNGVSNGFTKDLEIHGVGYRAEVSGQDLKLSLGYSHPVEFKVPDGVKVSVEKNTKISVSGCDRQQVGQVAANIRAFRKPDVYKLKGIRYVGEHLRKKAGKTATK
jgi:large subunit ribosomal protein L6